MPLMLLSLALVGCGNGDRPVGDFTNAGDLEPVQGDWLIVSLGAEADTLNQITSSNGYSTQIYYGALGSQIGESLLGYDPETWRPTKPLLAESYPEISDDLLTYTFTMRDGVRWHDGASFSAEDVLFSAKVAMLPLVDSAPLRGYLSDLVDVQIEDRQVRFQVSQPYWLNDYVLSSLPLVPKHVYDPEGNLDGYSFAEVIDTETRDDPVLQEFAQAFNRHPANRAPVGTGPYRFDRWDSGSQIVIVRNDDYWGEAAYLERIVYRFITDPTAALTALRSGETDFFPRLTPIQSAQQTDSVRFTNEFGKTSYRIPVYRYIAWNPMRPFFADKRVRQAMTMLIPRERIIEQVWFGLGDVAMSPFNPSSPDFNPGIEPYPHDPARATALLEEAGWIDHDGDGIRDKDGVKFSFELMGTAGTPYVEQLLPILKDQFAAVGIEMLERRLEFTVMADSARDKQFDALTMAWLSDLVGDPYQLWHSSSALNRGSNYVSYNNPRVDRLIENARFEFDPVQRRELYWEFQEILHEDQPYTFLMYPEDSAAYHRRFQNAEFLPARPGYDLTQWFVPAAIQKYGPIPD